MHQTRQEASTKLPIKRKGTKYVARAKGDLKNSVPVVIAVRDMLKLARTSKEVHQMIKQKLLKVNGRIVMDPRESIGLFNILEAGKSYTLTLLPTKKFTFKETSIKEGRLCKVVNKRLVSNGKIQFNLHDGSNIITKEKIKIGDSIYLDLSGKILKHIPLEKGKKVLIYKGKYIGLYGKINSVEGKNIHLTFDENGSTANLQESSIIAI